MNHPHAKLAASMPGILKSAAKRVLQSKIKPAAWKITEMDLDRSFTGKRITGYLGTDAQGF